MKVITSEITEYWVHFQAGPKQKNLTHARAIIKCYHDDVFVLRVNFHLGKKNIPENYHSVNSKLVYLHYPMSMFSKVLDILRNEKPIYFSYSEPTKLGFIRTGTEPVGEGEIEKIELEEVL